MTAEEENGKYDYSTVWLPDYVEIKLGGKWATRVGLIQDAKGVKKLRVAKGRYKQDGSFSQVQKFNVKWQGELDQLLVALASYRAQLPVKEPAKDLSVKPQVKSDAKPLEKKQQ